MEKKTACSDFHVDLAAEYGVCKNCGLKKAQHAAVFSSSTEKEGSVHDKIKLFSTPSQKLRDSQPHKEKEKEKDLPVTKTTSQTQDKPKEEKNSTFKW